MKLSVSLFALIAATTTVHAADLYVEEPAIIAEAAAASTWGSVGIGALWQSAEQTDDAFEGSAFGGYVSAALWTETNGFVLGVDGYFETADFVPQDAPNHAGVVGAHLGFGSADAMLGAFGSIGFYPESPDGETQVGFAAGLEGIADVGAAQLFGQLGYADARADDSSGFTGAFTRVGALFSLSDEFAVVADLGAGWTEDFTDPGEAGSYVTAGLEAAIAVPVDFSAFFTLGYEYASYEAEGETASTHAVKVGLSIPFGDSTAAQALNPLATDAAPYRAASWGDVLD